MQFLTLRQDRKELVKDSRHSLSHLVREKLKYGIVKAGLMGMETKERYSFCGMDFHFILSFILGIDQLGI